MSALPYSHPRRLPADTEPEAGDRIRTCIGDRPVYGTVREAYPEGDLSVKLDGIPGDPVWVRKGAFTFFARPPLAFRRTTMQPTMQPTVQDLIQALNSGTYTHLKEQLGTDRCQPAARPDNPAGRAAVRPGKYRCCLGVYAEIAGIAQIGDNGRVFIPGKQLYSSSYSFIPTELRPGWMSDEVHADLARINDHYLTHDYSPVIQYLEELATTPRTRKAPQQ